MRIYPGLSRLVLTNEGGRTETVFAHEIGAMRLEQTELVVLAACRTNLGHIRRGEGVLGLARPFIAAGVPAVIASLADVDDSSESSAVRCVSSSLAGGSKRHGRTP